MAKLLRRAVSGRAMLVFASAAMVLACIFALPAAFEGSRSATVFSIPLLWAYGLFAVPVLVFICLKVAWRHLDRIR